MAPPPWDPPEFSWGPQNAQDVLQKSLRERFRRHLQRSCALLRPISLHKSAPDAFWAPFWDQNLCSRRGESIDFRKSAFPLSIFILGSKSPLKALMAFKTHLETLFGRLWGSLGAILGALGPFWSAQGPPGGTPTPVWDQFWKDLAWIWRSVRQRKKAFTTSLSKKNYMVSPYKRYKMLCAHAVKITVRRHRDTYCNQDTGQWALWRGRRAAH